MLLPCSDFTSLLSHLQVHASDLKRELTSTLLAYFVLHIWTKIFLILGPHITNLNCSSSPHVKFSQVKSTTVLSSNACRCVKSFGKAEPDLELIYVPTHSELVREWEHTSVVFRHQKWNKGEAFLRFSLKGQLSRQRAWAHPSSDPYLHYFSLTLGCFSEMRVLSIS